MERAMKSNHGVSGPRVRRPLRGVTGILALALTAAAAVPVHPLLAQDSRQGRPLSLQTALLCQLVPDKFFQCALCGFLA